MEPVALKGPSVRGVRRWCPICTRTFYVEDELHPMSGVTYSRYPVWLVLREGTHGKFWGCPRFPKCKYSESVPKPKRVYLADIEAHWDGEDQ
jgi:hypothetical protein